MLTEESTAQHDTVRQTPAGWQQLLDGRETARGKAQASSGPGLCFPTCPCLQKPLMPAAGLAAAVPLVPNTTRWTRLSLDCLCLSVHLGNPPLSTPLAPPALRGRQGYVLCSGGCPPSAHTWLRSYSLSVKSIWSSVCLFTAPSAYRHILHYPILSNLSCPTLSR
jgi:hypothetical protein